MDIFRKDYPQLVLGRSIYDKSGISTLSDAMYSSRLCDLIVSGAIVPFEEFDEGETTESMFTYDGEPIEGVILRIFPTDEAGEPTLYKVKNDYVYSITQPEREALIELVLAQAYRNGIDRNVSLQTPFCINFLNIYDATICGRNRNGFVGFKFVEEDNTSLYDFMEKTLLFQNKRSNTRDSLPPLIQLHIIFQILFLMAFYQEVYGITNGAPYPDNFCVINLSQYKNDLYDGMNIKNIKYFRYDVDFGDDERKSYYLPSAPFIIKMKNWESAEKLKSPMIVSENISEESVLELTRLAKEGMLERNKERDFMMFLDIIDNSRRWLSCIPQVGRWYKDFFIREGRDAKPIDFFRDGMFDSLTERPVGYTVAFLGNIPAK